MRVRSATRGVLLVQRAIGLGPQRSLPQGQQQLPAGPDEHAPAARSEGERHDEQQHRDGVGGRAVDGEGNDRRHPQEGDHDGGSGRAVHGQRRQRQKTRRGGRGRDRAQDKTDERHGDGPPPPPPQRQARQQARADIDGDLPDGEGIWGVMQLGTEEQGAQREGHDDRHYIDDPLAPDPAVGHVGMGQCLGCRRRPCQRGPRPTRPRHIFTVDLRRNRGQGRTSLQP